jgi:predicted membrane chloride channel (bestrophin family)
MALIAAAITLLVVFILREDKTGIMQVKNVFAVQSFAVLLALVVAFRTNIAYARYEEGMDCLEMIESKWVDCFSMLTAFVNTELSEKIISPDDCKKLRELHLAVYHWLSLMGGITVLTLRDEQGGLTLDHFRYEDERSEIESYEQRYQKKREPRSRRQPFLPDEDKQPVVYGKCNQEEMMLERSSDPALQVALWIMQAVASANCTGLLHVDPPVLSRFYQELTNGALGLCHAYKLATVPFPFPFAQILALLLVFLMLAVPIMAANTVGANELIAALTAFFGILGYVGLNQISIELECPFGTDPNDLPLLEFQRYYSSVLRDILHCDPRPRFIEVAPQKPAASVDAPGTTCERALSLNAYLSDRKLPRFSSKLRFQEIQLFGQAELKAKFGPEAAVAVRRQIAILSGKGR